jgi:DNA-binding IclR family transcriptional regulator
VLLAWAPPDVVRQVLGRELPRFTGNTPTAEQVLAGLPQIRATGRVVSRGELDPGAVSAAVPVFCRGEVVCSLNVAGPEGRCGSKAWLNSTFAVLDQAARNLAESLESATSFQSTREIADALNNRH